MSRGRIEPHAAPRRAARCRIHTPRMRTYTSRLRDDVGVCTICWRLRPDRHQEIYFITLHTREGSRQRARAKKLTSDSRGQRRGSIRRGNRFSDTSGIRAQRERRYWWWGVISTSARIVCQSRNMVAHINERALRASAEDWNLINPIGTLLGALILQQLVEGMLAIYFHLFWSQPVVFVILVCFILLIIETWILEIAAECNKASCDQWSLLKAWVSQYFSDNCLVISITKSFNIDTFILYLNTFVSLHASMYSNQWIK